MARNSWTRLISLVAAVTIFSQSIATASLDEVSCERGFEPALLALWYGELADPTNAGTQHIMRNTIIGAFRDTKRAAGLTNSATAVINREGKIGGMLLFQEISKRELGPVEGLQYFFDAADHQDYLGLFATNAQTIDGQIGAALQTQVCVPEEYREYPTGKYHINLIVDVKAGSDCTKTVLGFLKSTHGIADEFGEDFMAEVPAVCGQQTKIDTAFSAAASLFYNRQCVDTDQSGACTSFDVDDVGCIFNFNSRNSRDATLKWLLGESDVPTEVEECIAKYWIVSLN